MTLPPGLKYTPESESVALDRPVTLVHATPDAEKLVVKMARVSNPKNEDNWDTGPRLLRYLMRSKHWSPFEMVNMCVRVETELDVAMQLIRHRSMSYQQFSCRYAKTSQAKVPQFRRQDTKNRQNSFDDFTDDQQAKFQRMAQYSIDVAWDTYEALLEQEVALETARRILPVCTPTVIYVNGTARSWVHYLTSRTHWATQKEHRVIADQMKEIFDSVFPITTEAVEWPE